MSQPTNERPMPGIALRLLRAPLEYVLGLVGRFGRHWFLFGVLFGGMCLAIRGSILRDYGVAFLFREDRTWPANWNVTDLLHSQASGCLRSISIPRGRN
jgi:hypothetical protein